MPRPTSHLTPPAGAHLFPFVNLLIPWTPPGIFFPQLNPIPIEKPSIMTDPVRDVLRPVIESRPNGLSVRGVRGVGLIMRGSPLHLTDANALPNGTSDLTGVEAALHFEGFEDGASKGEIGQLTLNYYQGHVTERFSQKDLPLEGMVADLVKFNLRREATTHYLLGEWRWPSGRPAYSEVWDFLWGTRVTAIDPSFSAGMGGAIIRTTVAQGDEPSKSSGDTVFVATGSTAADILRFEKGPVEVAASGAIRVFAGGVNGIAGLFETTLRLRF